VIFHVHGKVLGQRLQTGAFGYCPRLQNAVTFQSEIIMQARCVMALNAEKRLLSVVRRWTRFWLGSLVKGSLFDVLFQGHDLFSV
jgi:hypothetical protein